MHAIDFHAHSFPDSLAPRAISGIEGKARIKSVIDGTIASLVRSMDRAGIEKSVILSIATKPTQFDSILEWSRLIASPRIVPLLSVHPEDPHARQNIQRAAREGFIGMKLHPFYQGFALDAESVFPIYEALEENGLLCVCHTGFDHAWSYTRMADPPRIVNVMKRFPRLKFVATHLGAWRDWDSAAELLPAAGVFIDIAYSLEFLPPEKARKLIMSFPADRILFGSDSPWGDQAAALTLLSRLGLDEALERAIRGGNAACLLERQTAVR